MKKSALVLIILLAIAIPASASGVWSLMFRPSTIWVVSFLDYGEMYSFNEFDPTQVVISDANEYYQIPLGDGERLDILYDDGNLIIQSAGEYLINYTVSFEGGVNSLYGISVGLNHARQENCYAHRQIGTAADVGDASGNCFLDLAVGDKVVLFIEDETTPVSNAYIHMANLSIEQVTT